MSFVEIKGVKKSYGEGEAKTTVLSGIDLSIEKGEFCVLLGPSGSGKSTLLNIIGGIDNADEGYVMIDGEKTADMNEKRLTQYRRDHLGYVFQLYNLIPNLTVRENVEVGAFLSKHPLDTDDLLKTLGLYEHRHKLPTQLSGGQQQRTAIGRAVIKNPDILLCDEPTGALDYNTSKEILTLLERINKEYGNTVIMVTHNDAIAGGTIRILSFDIVDRLECALENDGVVIAGRIAQFRRIRIFADGNAVGIGHDDTAQIIHGLLPAAHLLLFLGEVIHYD